MNNSLPVVEIIGYAGSVLVAVSLMMSSILKLRIINFIGGTVFSVYGFIIGALPVGFLNGIIALVDLYYLFEIVRAKEYFEVLEVKHDSEYLNYFINFHSKEIRKFIPSFSFKLSEKSDVFFILRNSVPAGLVYGEFTEDGALYIKLDFAIPGYRDFKMGNYVFKRILKEKNIDRIFSDPGHRRHEKYLKKMGFMPSKLGSKSVYVLKIS